MSKPLALVLGAGIFGLKAAVLLLERGYRVKVIEADEAPFLRASLINQARVHAGYHYPRSITTGLPSKAYFQRFVEEFRPAIVDSFTQIYAIGKRSSFTSFRRFETFCNQLGIPLKEVPTERYFATSAVEACYETKEFAFDAQIIGNQLLQKAAAFSEFELLVNTTVSAAHRVQENFEVQLSDGKTFLIDRVVNATYASLNSQLQLFDFEPLSLKYELAEIVLGTVSPTFSKVGITVMDGAYFSIMPWGQGSLHSLTSVEYTPRKVSVGEVPQFECMSLRKDCNGRSLKNCDSCEYQPQTAATHMIQVARKFLNHSFDFRPQSSRFAVKAILNRSEVDDSRPTLVSTLSRKPDFITVFSGKINTIYDLEDTLV